MFHRKQESFHSKDERDHQNDEILLSRIATLHEFHATEIFRIENLHEKHATDLFKHETFLFRDENFKVKIENSIDYLERGEEGGRKWHYLPSKIQFGSTLKKLDN